MGCAGKAERCGSKCARAHLDSAKKASLWLDCGLRGRQRCGLLPARRSNAAGVRQRGSIGCVALSPVSTKARVHNAYPAEESGQLRFLGLLLTPVLQVVQRVITRHLLDQSGFKADQADGGAVRLIQRFGSAANLNILDLQFASNKGCSALQSGVGHVTGWRRNVRTARAPRRTFVLVWRVGLWRFRFHGLEELRFPHALGL